MARVHAGRREREGDGRGIRSAKRLRLVANAALVSGPQYVTTPAIFARPNEMLPFKQEFETSYAGHWSDNPKRRLLRGGVVGARVAADRNRWLRGSWVGKLRSVENASTLSRDASFWVPE